MIDLVGQTALVTGGSRGIGRAAALLLARAGADVALTFHTRAEEAESAAREIEALGRRTFVAGGDLANPEMV
jgi:NAD(P)-dependent dehydrogenase (short-subunit alcohol dehydrogenase family)